MIERVAVLLSVEIPEAAIKALSVLKRAVDTGRCAVPILEHVLIERSGSELIFTATNLAARVAFACPVEFGASFATTVPVAALVAALKGAKSAMLTIEDSGEAVVQAGAIRRTLPTFLASEFPPTPSWEPKAIIESTFRDLAEPLARAASFCATEPARGAVLMGVLVDVRSAGVRAIATDGFKLMVAPLVSEVSLRTGAVTAILPSEMLTVLTALKPGQASPLARLAIGERYARLESGGYTVYGYLADGPYPNVDAVVPVLTADTPRAVVSRKSLIDATSAIVKAAVSRRLPACTFQQSGPSELSVATASEVEGTCSASVSATRLDSGFPKIGMNAKKIETALRAFGCGDIEIAFGSPLQPLLFLDPSDETGAFALVMPLRQ